MNEPSADRKALYDRVLAMVAADLRHAPVHPVVEVQICGDELTYTYRSGEGTTERTNVPLQDDETLATTVLAEFVQDNVLDDLGGPAWPVCPDHPHPASPTVVNSQPVWVCPRTHAVIASIGSLER